MRDQRRGRPTPAAGDAASRPSIAARFVHVKGFFEQGLPVKSQRVKLTVRRRGAAASTGTLKS
jgi:hypothetical protein